MLSHGVLGRLAMAIVTIGLDTAKSWFQVHGVDESGRVVLRRKLARSKVLQFFAGLTPCVIGLEACGGAHFWARELIKLGHDARLMPARYVRAYVKTNKHDAADAEACCEAVQRPGMRFVPVKSEEQQSMLMVPPSPRSAGSPAHCRGQCSARTPGRVRHHRGIVTAA